MLPRMWLLLPLSSVESPRLPCCLNLSSHECVQLELAAPLDIPSLLVAAASSLSHQLQVEEAGAGGEAGGEVEVASAGSSTHAAPCHMMQSDAPCCSTVLP
jgi:hypothetical protein